VGAELFHVDRTDMMKLTVAFHNFANAPKKYISFLDLAEKAKPTRGCKANGRSRKRHFL
jgi:hypothetical protein